MWEQVVALRAGEVMEGETLVQLLLDHGLDELDLESLFLDLLLG